MNNSSVYNEAMIMMIVIIIMIIIVIVNKITAAMLPYE